LLEGLRPSLQQVTGLQRGKGCFRQVKDLPRIRAAKPKKTTDVSLVTASRFFLIGSEIDQTF
jgi:hypothetical protein